MSPKRSKLFEEPEHEDISVRRGLAPPSADMNVTPLIDVLLVLLVIFLAALPLAQHGADINLPREVTEQVQQEVDNTQITLEVASDLSLTVNQETVAYEELQPRLRAMLEPREQKTIFLLGPASARYGQMMAVIDAANGAGARVVIVTERMRTTGR